MRFAALALLLSLTGCASVSSPGFPASLRDGQALRTLRGDIAYFVDVSWTDDAGVNQSRRIQVSQAEWMRFWLGTSEPCVVPYGPFEVRLQVCRR